MRYAFLSLDGCTETGSAAAVTVADRGVSLWLGLTQVAFPMSNETATFEPRRRGSLDFERRRRLAIVLGQTVGFAPGGNNQVTGFFGATATITINGSMRAFLDGEIHVGDDGLDRSEGRAGLKISF